MPRIRCRYEDCVFLESGFCSAERIELDPETGCLTYQQAEEVEVVEGWTEEEPVELLDDEEEEIDWEDEDEDDEEEEEDERW